MKGSGKETQSDDGKDLIKDRLNKRIAKAGICSRRAADDLIAQGRVKVNGKVVVELGVRVLESDSVEVDGRVIDSKSKSYVLVNKPRNVICTNSDEKDRKTIIDILPDKYKHLYPVGRLDRNTTGIILLTNDGILTQNLLHPSKKIKKIYKVKLENRLTQEELNKLVTGIELEDGVSKFDKISELNEDSSFRYGIEIHSGKNRIIRRTFEELGNNVIKLDRVMFHTFDKRKLGRAEHRELSDKELKALEVYLKTKK